jgi:hypothetical protein
VDIDLFQIQMRIYRTADSNQKRDGVGAETKIVGYILSSVDSYSSCVNLERDLNFHSCVVKKKRHNLH